MKNSENNSASEQDPFTTLSAKTVHENPYYRVDHEQYIKPDGKQGDYYPVVISDSCMVAAYSNGTYIMVRQFRYLLNDWSIEFPAGGYEEGETPEEGAKRELFEETGVQADDLERIGQYHPYNGVTRETCHVYFTSNFARVDANPDGDERIEVVQMTSEDIEQAIQDGTISDGMTMAAWHLIREYQKNNSNTTTVL